MSEEKMHTVNNIILEINAMKYIVNFKALIQGEMSNGVHGQGQFNVS